MHDSDFNRLKTRWTGTRRRIAGPPGKGARMTCFRGHRPRLTGQPQPIIKGPNQQHKTKSRKLFVIMSLDGSI
jgi:hypothetical protein